ncbi:MAG: protoheme IX farnesyltransferase [Chlamydiales bacterium]|nr:protoheme IX farnesyltransferase [Chlamydiales bacterium]
MSAPLFFVTLLAIASMIASACVFNNYIDRKADQNMTRTQNRPLARGDISIKNALFFACTLNLFSTALLFLFTNTCALIAAWIGFAVYVFFYSFLKYRSSAATLVGSIAGAMPPMIGYCAVSAHPDLAAWLLFATVALWQMPHFYAIAIYRIEDYRKAKIPVLPLKKGIIDTQVQMLFYILGFILASSLLTFTGYVHYSFLLITAFLGSFWFFLGLKGFKLTDPVLWARKMFIASLVVITSQFFSLFFIAS